MAVRSADTSGAPFLKLDQIGVAYGGYEALKSLSLEVQRGEFFCLLGTSGCGKTTTLNVVAGFSPITAGRLLLDGRDVTNDPPDRRQLGLVFQSYALFPHMTVAENIGYGLKIRRKPKDEIDRRVAEMVALVRLDGKADRYPRQLSGGEQQRVGIARALAIEPRLLLLDEPLSNLDARLREDLRNELKRIQRITGVTTIFVTHDQEEAFGAADRIAILNRGKLEQVGTPSEIYSRPQTMFVAQFIGRSNFLRGQVSGSDKVLATNGMSVRLAADTLVAPGEYVLVLRPEEMRIGAPAGPDDNHVQASVSDIVHGGSMQKMTLTSPLGELLSYRLGADASDLRVGDTVTVSWSRNAGALLPGGPE